MKTYRTITILAIGLSATAVVSAQNCKLTGNTYDTGHGVYACGDGYGNVTLGDRNGNPIRQQEARTPPVNSNSFGSALSGQRAAQDDMATLQQIQQQQVQQQQQMQQQRAPAETHQWQRSALNQAQQDERTQGRKSLTLPANMLSKLATIKKSAEKGEWQGQAVLGAFYWYGANVPRNSELAVKWFMKAAAQGDSGSEDNLALAYALGEGVAHDSVLAYAWWNLAVAQGNEHAAGNVKVVESEMSPSQIEEAQRLSANWKPGTLIVREAGIR